MSKRKLTATWQISYEVLDTDVVDVPDDADEDLLAEIGQEFADNADVDLVQLTNMAGDITEAYVYLVEDDQGNVLYER